MSTSPDGDLIVTDSYLSDSSAFNACKKALESASPGLLACSTKPVAYDNVRQRHLFSVESIILIVRSILNTFPFVDSITLKTSTIIRVLL